MTKRIERHRQKSQQELNQLCAIEFACIAEATAVADKLSQQMIWHQLAEIEIVEKKHYDKPGKPKPDAVTSRLTVVSSLNLQERNILNFLVESISAARSGEIPPSLLP